MNTEVHGSGKKEIMRCDMPPKIDCSRLEMRRVEGMGAKENARVARRPGHTTDSQDKQATTHTFRGGLPRSGKEQPHSRYPHMPQRSSAHSSTSTHFPNWHMLSSSHSSFYLKASSSLNFKQHTFPHSVIKEARPSPHQIPRPPHAGYLSIGNINSGERG